MILGIDHVGIAVRDAAGAAATFERLWGRPATAVEHLAEQAVRVCFVPDWASAEANPAAAPLQDNPVDARTARSANDGGQRAIGMARLELLEPTGDGTPVGRFLARRGEGLHHVCFAVDDLALELARLEAAGFEPIDRAPRRGHGGLVAFLHPKSAHGVLIELLQRDAGPTIDDRRRTTEQLPNDE